MKLYRQLALGLTLWLFILALTACDQISGPEASDDYAEQKLMLDNGHYQVPGILVIPKQRLSNKLPAVVMLHGTASQKNEVGGLYRRLAIALANQGIASLRIDFAGTGDSPVDYRQYTLSSAQQDALTAINYLTRQAAIDPQRIGVIGFSQGGLIAQLVAVKDPRIKAMVTWSSVANNGIGPFQSMFDQYYAEAEQNGYAVVKFPWRARPLNFSLQWFNGIKTSNALDQMANYNGRLLAIAGTGDHTVPYVSSIKLIDTVASPMASLYLVKNANHMFNVLGDPNSNGLAVDQSKAEEVLALTSNWFGRQL